MKFESGGGAGELDRIILIYINIKLWVGFMFIEMEYDKLCFRRMF